ncbi:hypothetical protein B0H11DRAFT_2429168 [Mycena galericulata]|nr:hypothetical protein B0H11DRAFT_2429168 [Mycena galericulata]
MRAIPTEIIHAILLDLPTSCQAKVCTVSQKFHRIAAPVLYRDIQLLSLKKTTRCCVSLLGGLGSMSRALLVRSFVVTPVAGESYANSLDLMLLLDRVLNMLREVEHLHIWIPNYDNYLFNALAPLYLPRLRRFGCHQPGAFHDKYLTTFLARHPALTHLVIIRPRHYLDPEKRLSVIPLPALQYYCGSASYFLRIEVPNRRLAHASFWDIPRCAKPTRNTVSAHKLAVALAAASIASPGSRLALCILGDAFGAETVPLFARALPHLQTLEIGPFLGPPTLLQPNMALYVAEALTALPYLTTFSLNNTADLLSTAAAGSDTVKGDGEVVTAWGERCPSLLTSRLHNRCWQRATDGRWLLLK